MAGPLSHIRVLDLTRVVAGPWGTQILGDMGAEIIKVERPGKGDDTRGFAPPFMKTPDGESTRESAYFPCVNRSKKSLELDIARPEGQEILRRLAKESDIFIENYKVGNLQRYGLDYATLKEINPRLIYCSVTGYGQTGPYSSMAGYDFVFQGMSGLMSITGVPDGQPGAGPQKIGVAVTDIMAGMYATIAVLGALAHRDVTGVGQYIDLALLDCSMAMLMNVGTIYLSDGKIPGRLGNSHGNAVPYQLFPSKDGQVILAVGNNDQFVRFCEIAGRTDIAQDPRFSTAAARVAHRDILIPMLQDVMKTRTSMEWLKALEPAGIPCGPVNNVAEAFEDPQVRHRETVLEMPHPVAGKVRLIASPLRFSETPVEYRDPPPVLGQHTAEILRDILGMDEAAIGALAGRGVVGLRR